MNSNTTIFDSSDISSMDNGVLRDMKTQEQKMIFQRLNYFVGHYAFYCPQKK